MNYSKLFIEMAEIGAQMDVLRALFLLSEAYIDSCGISLSSRTVYYIAAEGWLNKLGESEHELAIDARHQALVNLFPIINNRYIPEKYDHYDISPMNEDEYIEVAEYLLRTNIGNEELTQALCAGILFINEQEDLFDCPEIYQGIFDVKKDDSFYTLFLFKSDLSDSQFKTHLFSGRTLMKDFHFVVDLSWYLATDELKLTYQKNSKTKIEVSDERCSWSGYEDIYNSLIEYLKTPVSHRCLRYNKYENNLHKLIAEHDDCAKEMKVKTILEKMVDIGLEPLKKYENYMK